MTISKKLIKMAKKWQRIASLGRKRISSPTTIVDVDVENCSISVADEGHFVVYTADQRRFMIPLLYLNNEIFRELFSMSEKFGLPSGRPLTLHCDSIFMEYMVPLFHRGVAKDIEKALLISLTTSSCSLLSFSQQHMIQQSLV